MSAKKVRPLRCTKSPSLKKALDVPEQCCGLSLPSPTGRIGLPCPPRPDRRPSRRPQAAQSSLGEVRKCTVPTALTLRRDLPPRCLVGRGLAAIVPPDPASGRDDR